MAKRKKTKKRTTHRRRRVSGLGTMSHGIMGKVMKLGGMVLGNAIGIAAQKRIPFDPRITGAVVGFGGLYLEDHAHNPIMIGLAQGVANTGATALAHGFHVINGVDDFVNGIEDMSGGYLEDRTDMRGLNNNEHMQGVNNEATLNGSSSFM